MKRSISRLKVFQRDQGTQNQHNFKIYFLDDRRKDSRRWYIRQEGEFPIPRHLLLQKSRFALNSHELTDFRKSYRLYLAGLLRNRLYFFTAYGDENKELYGAHLQLNSISIFQCRACPHNRKLKREIVRKTWQKIRKETMNHV